MSQITPEEQELVNKMAWTARGKMTHEKQAMSMADLVKVEQVSINCFECGNSFETLKILAHRIKFCPECSVKKDEQFERDYHERNALTWEKLESENSNPSPENWKKICPPAFQETEPHRLPIPEKLNQVLSWQFGRTGLILHGPTGSGKSRCAWKLLEREFFHSRKIKVVDYSANLTFSSKYSSSPAMAEQWLKWLAEIDLLFLDDVFKSSLSPGFEGAIFAVISTRIDYHRPLILTTNDVGATLIGRLSPDRGQPLIRRLRESCKSISFNQIVPVSVPKPKPEPAPYQPPYKD